MASSLQTLVKILKLEQQKEYQNTAVIGGFARFAYHWAREAHGQAQTDEHHTLIDAIADRLRDYDTMPAEQRPSAVEEIITMATGDASADAPIPQRQAPSRQQQTAEREPQQQPARQLSMPIDPEIDFDTGESNDDGYDEGEFEGVAPVRETPRDALVDVRERRGYAHRPPAVGSPEILQKLNDPVSSAKGIGDKRAELLARLDITTIGDLITLFPRRYDDYSRMKLIKDLSVGEEISVMGVVERISTQRMPKGRTRVECYLNDGSASLRLNWFNQPWIEKQIEKGEPYVASGKIEQYLGRLVMNSPEIEALERESLHAGRVVPVYPLTKGLSGRVMRRLMKDFIDEWAPRLPDSLPIEVREHADLMDYDDAISQAHFPDSWEDKDAALHRLAFDDLFTLHMAMLQRRYQWQARDGLPLPTSPEWRAAFVETLPFTLTGAQAKALEDILGDMSTEAPMNRLLQGDVGSGKTIIATIAIAAAIANGAQAALMAPTSILAEQHYQKIKSVLENSPLADSASVALLTGNISAGEKAAVYAGLESGSINIVVGTHAVIQEGVTFQNLALGIVDEQHRFGVEQRGALRSKANGHSPHLLVMTATPIPRTLALTLHADLDLTIIDELPPGRQPIDTRVLQPKERERAYSFVRGQIEAGRQAYIICPLVEDSDSVDARSAVAEYERLQNTVFPDLAVGLLHGRMTASDKDAVMESFYNGEIQILVSTTVIEVGIDVSNASVIMVENANRFGLAQLHQLRGRVGRGEHTSYCLLVSDKPFFDQEDRLALLEENTDGFSLAEHDWRLRGPGDLMGTQQSGVSQLQFIQMMNPHLLELVQHEAAWLYEQDPTLDNPEHAQLRERVQAVLGDGGDIS